MPGASFEAYFPLFLPGESRSVTYQYDTDGRHSKIVDGNGNETALAYEDLYTGCSSCGGGVSADKPSKIFYPTFTREVRYDKRGRKTLEQDDPGTGEPKATQFQYDAAGNLVSRTDKAQKVTALRV